MKKKKTTVSIPAPKPRLPMETVLKLRKKAVIVDRKKEASRTGCRKRTG